MAMMRTALQSRVQQACIGNGTMPLPPADGCLQGQG